MRHCQPSPQHQTSAPAALRFSAALAAWAALSIAAAPARADNEAAEVERRLSQAVEYLASDELEGRGLGSEGIEKAAQFIHQQFVDIGLDTNLFDGTGFQRFEIPMGTVMGPQEDNRLALLGPPADGQSSPRRIELKLEGDFRPLAAGGSGEFNLPLVFVGYGITANEHGYDDYAGVDVEDKAVVMLRHEPQQSLPDGPFEGPKPTQYARFSRKIANAFEHGAAVVVIVNDHHEVEQSTIKRRAALHEAVDKLLEKVEQLVAENEPAAEKVAEYQAELEKLAEAARQARAGDGEPLDELIGFYGAGNQSSHKKMPVFFCTRQAFDEAVRATLDTDLAGLEQAIDEDLAPRSRELTGWRAVGKAALEHRKVDVMNVIASLEGEGPLADETIVVGAHYDHLGRGSLFGSLAPWTRAIHNGADDNASGTVAVIEVARRLAGRETKLPRRVVFMAFTGEEKGLLGSAHYVRNPRFPLDKTVAMVNFDMVGRLADNKLIAWGSNTAEQFDPLLDRLNETHGFELSKRPGGFGPSDQASFYGKKIPVLHFFTGLHGDYHRPSDDADKINAEGMRRIVEMATDLIVEVAEAEQPPTYVQSGRPRQRDNTAAGDRPYFGSVPEFGREVDGYALAGVAKDGPAAKAGIQAGDIIIRFGSSKIGGLEDFHSALLKFKPGDEVPVVVQRDGQEINVTVKLEKR